MLIRFIKPAASTGAQPKTLVLASLEEEIIIVGKITFDSRILAEIADFPEADEIESFYRGNLQKQIAFMAKREHPDEGTAELFAEEHDEETLGKGTLVTRGGGNEWERFYNGAICVRCATYAEGVATWSSYEFTTGLSSKKKKT